MTATAEKHAEVWLHKNNPHTTHGSAPKFQDVINNHLHQSSVATESIANNAKYLADRTDVMMEARSGHLDQQREQIQQNIQTLTQNLQSFMNSWKKAYTPQQLWQEWLSYNADSSKRFFQTADILKERGDIFLEHELAGCPPVLDYDYEIIMDASEFKRPCNYVLLKILPPAGISTNDENRPYVIIDPRAGHGAGIGGFKSDSQVGVALNQGHPVYFVAFKRMPEPNQTIADITYAEGLFVREIENRHPKAPAPVVIGNCQGGWAALILAATNPEIKGPIVLNGSPVSAWSGQVGINPMRYKAGTQGGTWQSLLTSDLGNGVFDGSWLVHNFEQMNPSRNYVSKYYDLYKNPLANRERFLDFERWWGGFFLMNDEEIRWIVENIFVGNRLSRNTGQLEKGVNIDLRNIKAPIIVFASHGDNITPPPQALSWILDTYSDETEVEVCGQRIIYMVHEQVGHLGIFVSSKIAKREHKGIASILEMIEALPPGLFELNIENTEGKGQDKSFSVSFQRRTFADLSEAMADEKRTDEKPFRAVHRFSKAQTRTYEVTMRPLVKAISSETSAQMLRTMHPMRLQRSLWNSKNPLAMATSNLSKALTKNADNETKNFVAAKHEDAKAKDGHDVNVKALLPAIESMAQDNLFLQVEKMFMDSLTMTMDLWRDWQGMYTENLFYSVWTLPWLRVYGQKEGSRRLHDKEALKELPTVAAALSRIEEGGFNEAVVRMLILSNIVADNNIDRDQLMRVTEVLTEKKPFNELSQPELASIMHTQTLIVRFDEDNSIATLPKLIKTKPKRVEAYSLIRYIIGSSVEDMLPDTLNMIKRLEQALSVTEADLK